MPHLLGDDIMGILLWGGLLVRLYLGILDCRGILSRRGILGRLTLPGEVALHNVLGHLPGVGDVFLRVVFIYAAAIQQMPDVIGGGLA